MRLSRCAAQQRPSPWQRLSKRFCKIIKEAFPFTKFFIWGCLGEENLFVLLCLSRKIRKESTEMWDLSGSVGSRRSSGLRAVHVVMLWALLLPVPPGSGGF